MQLTVPQRTDADAGSFPVEPEGVNKWLTQLHPTQSTSDAMEVYRGLRHTNRLHNDLNRRRAVINCFSPTLHDLHISLLEVCQAQPLPLTAEFQRSAQLLDGLLREEAFAYKILLADSPQPRGDDVRRAMHALAKQAEARMHGFKDIPESLLRDAQQLYELAEEFSLLDIATDEESRTTEDHYKGILIFSLADCKQHRVRQLPQLLEFLQEHASLLRIRKKIPADAAKTGSFAIHLKHGARPVPATSLLASSNKDVRWFNLSPLLTRVDVQLARSRAEELPLLGSDSLDRQAYARLRVTLANSRRRNIQRAIAYNHRHVVFSHKAICAHLNLKLAESKGLSPNASKNAADETLSAAFDALDNRASAQQHSKNQQWVIVNYSTQGAGLTNLDCRAGEVQVGELVSLESEAAHVEMSVTGRSKALIGVVRWVSATEGSTIHAGVEYLAKGVLPVGVTRTHGEDVAVDDALIVACKVKDAVMQTILLPAFLYQPGDRLTITLNDKTRAIKLNKSLQNNGLFAHFSMSEV